eukprot:TRINITY_DN6327_c0_g1_i2.p1 TRINITY_DN6327_c0_g1~~TRINITY_DN6327_c0_g1_i2.p1  ORF type:complete len:325 (+),score=46.67 TRINITY_DN6327_c0_g1_i2:244-1218(+)
MTSPKKRKVSDLSDADVNESDNQHKKRAIARPDGLIEKQSSSPSPAVKDEKDPAEHLAMILCSLAPIPASSSEVKSPSKSFSVLSMLNDTPSVEQPTAPIQSPPVEQKQQFSPRSDQGKTLSPVSSMMEEDSDEDDSSDSGTKDSQASGRKKKRHRTTPEQLRTLEETYEREKMPNQELRERLAKRLGMTPRRVQIWFQNKRAKEKRSKPSPRSSLQMHHHQPPSANPIHVNASEFAQPPNAPLINAYFATADMTGRYLPTPSPFTQGPLNPPLIPSLFSTRPIQNQNNQTQLPGLNHDLMFGSGNSAADFAIRLPPILRASNE